MIYSRTKRYQVTLWTTANRSGVAVHLEFDTRDDAVLAFEQSKSEGQYAVGILYEWDQHKQEWSLLSQYPSSLGDAR